MRLFALLLAALLLMPEPFAAAGSPHAHRRSELINSRLKFERDRRGHVAFMGGSITEMNGYRPMVCDDLQQRFPDTRFQFTDAGIASTCSTTGAFRLEHDVLSKGPVDLFFIEFAVNDDQDAGHARRECLRGMEGILRQCLRHNPRMDIVVTYFVNEGMLATLHKGEVPLTMAAHEEVAEHYGVSTVHLATEVADQIRAGRLTWEKYGGVHPAPFGNRIAADLVKELLSSAWSKPLAADAQPVAQSLPQPLDEGSYGAGRFIAPAQATITSGWTLGVPAWDSLPGSKRSRFTSLPMLSATEPGAEVTLKFQGRAIGVYVVAGPDAGMLEARVDGGEFRRVDLYHRFSGGLHYPRTVLLATDLPGAATAEHTLTLRVAADHNSSSKGHAARIMQFVAN